MKPKHLYVAVLVLFIQQTLHAQDNNLLNMLNDSVAAAKTTTYVTGTFKATHVINMQTTEAPAPGALSFVIQHRFGKLNSGAYNLWGLDNATLRLGFDYGITDWFAVGVGRSSLQKTFDGYLKFKLLRQTEGYHVMPVSVSLFTSVTNYTQDYSEKPFLTTSLRTAYVGQLIIARKLTRAVSLEVTPTFIHYNLVPTTADKNNEFAVGAGTRVKISKRMSINAEYNYLLPNQMVSTNVYNSFSLGWDIETGGHVFQLVFTNSQSMVESQYIGQTDGKWSNGDIYFGFNISRNFNISKKAKASAVPKS
ncbi:DUF5777 family beta-barrel protein [Chitinophagaceae bacterium LWZ2-11]